MKKKIFLDIPSHRSSQLVAPAEANWWLLQKPIGGSCRSQLVAPAEVNWWLLQKPIGGSCRSQLVAPAEANWWLLQKPIGGSCRSKLVAPAEANWWLLQKPIGGSCRSTRMKTFDYIITWQYSISCTHCNSFLYRCCFKNMLFPRLIFFLEVISSKCVI